jgi:shikimate kinase
MIEREVLLEILPRPGQLVATGGGCVTDPSIREALHRYGRVIWLRAPVSTLGQRIQGSTRPSLTGARPEEELAAVLAEREALYRECADQCIETSNCCLEEVSLVLEHFWSVLSHHDLR